MKTKQGSHAAAGHEAAPPQTGDGDRLVSILAASEAGVFVVSRDGAVLNANAAACRIAGYDLGELRQLACDEWARQAADAWRDLLASAAAHGAAHRDLGLVTRSGELREIAVCASAAADVVVCLLRDVTDRRREQAALEESQQQLKQANVQLEGTLAQSRELAQAAEAANRAKSAFLASMSHELRTPLNVINGLAATMAEQAHDPGEVHSAQLILESGQGLLGIIEELLDFSGLQAGKVRLEPRPFDLLGLITLLVRQVAVLARRKGLSFSYRIHSDVPARIVGDPRRVQQVLLNLLGNAVNYTQRGGVVFDVGALAREGRWHLCFTVADSGVGIPKADLQKLFQPFSRAEFGSARQVHGTGLGLAIARSFAQLMGGDIVVRSHAGKGTVFRCCFDVDETDGVSALRALKPVGFDGVRVLVVSSDRHTRRMLAESVRQWGGLPVVWNGPEVPMSREEIEGGVELAIVEAALARNLGAMLNRFLQVRADSRVVPVVWLSGMDRKWPVPPTARAVNAALPLDLAELARHVAGLLRPVTSGPAQPDCRLGERLPLRILVADDIPTNREMLRRLLQHLGYAAHLVVNGAEAVEATRLQAFDVILLDVEMPVMNGLAAAREIVRLQPDASRRPKIVALTANAQEGDRERCLAAGMDDYLSKPVLPSHIEACLQKLFGSGVAVEPVVAAPAPAPDLVDRAQLALMFPGLPRQQIAEILRQLQVSATRDLKSAWPRVGEACANRNCAHLAETAHGLKGCFTMLGWSRLAAYCHDAVTEARAGTFSGWAVFGPELQRLYDLSVAEMDCYLEDLTQNAGKPLAAPETGR